MEHRAIKRDEGPADLADPVFLLASPDADFVSGQLLVVDGGIEGVGCWRRRTSGASRELCGPSSTLNKQA